MKCEQVDAFGNVKERTFNPDSTLENDSYKDEYQVRKKFPSDFADLQNALCKVCPIEEQIFSLRTYPEEIGDELSRKVFRYDAPPGEFDPPQNPSRLDGHLNFVQHWLKEGPRRGDELQNDEGRPPNVSGRFINSEKRSYQSNGLLSAVQQTYPFVETRYEYDTF